MLVRERQTHTFHRVPKARPTRKKGQTKQVRTGSRHPGGQGHGTIRRPY